uniref:Uncharacterized protein n=1 Tax=Arundo donax TaxID=35708 RepID=A0A0A9HEQ9_ARUDO
MSTGISDSSSGLFSTLMIGYSGTGKRIILNDMGSYIRTLPARYEEISGHHEEDSSTKR